MQENMEMHLRLDGKFAAMVRQVQKEYAVTRPAAARMLIQKGFEFMQERKQIDA